MNPITPEEEDKPLNESAIDVDAAQSAEQQSAQQSAEQATTEDETAEEAQKIQNAHDVFFRASFSQKDIAQDYIQHFMEADVAQHIDLESLQLEPTSYVSAKLQDFCADLVWKAKFKDSEIRISFLLEHKSYAVAYPHLQLLRYMLEILETQRKNNEKFSLVIPIVIYHGKETWKVRSFSEYFEGIPEELKRYVPNFAYHLSDLSQFSDEVLIEMPIGKIRNALLAMRHARDQAYLRKNLPTILIYTEKYYLQDVEYFHKILIYLFSNAKFTPQELRETVQSIQSPINQKVMSTYELIIQEGIEKGIKQGIEKGMEKGMEKATTEKILAFCASLITKTQFSDAEIAALVVCSEAYVQRLREELDNQAIDA